jgi:hypothetical protein
MRRNILYWALVSAACMVACLPYLWMDVFGWEASSIVGDFLPALLWVVLFGLTYSLAGASKKRRWLPLLSGPLALWPAAVTLFTFLMWKLHGFAP